MAEVAATLYWPRSNRTEAVMVKVRFEGPRWVRLALSNDRAVLTVDAKELEQALAEAKAEERKAAA